MKAEAKEFSGQVQHFYQRAAYRLPNLSGHQKVKQYYTATPTSDGS